MSTDILHTFGRLKIMFSTLSRSLELSYFPFSSILFPLAILISGRSGRYYCQKALRRDRLFSVILAGAVGFLNLPRAVDELQSCSAQQSEGNHPKC
eukprot:8452042-Pyramimonas_sp.AAC.1